jgi:hypothetical protein
MLQYSLHPSLVVSALAALYIMSPHCLSIYLSIYLWVDR